MNCHRLQSCVTNKLQIKKKWMKCGKIILTGNFFSQSCIKPTTWKGIHQHTNVYKYFFSNIAFNCIKKTQLISEIHVCENDSLIGILIRYPKQSALIYHKMQTNISSIALWYHIPICVEFNYSKHYNHSFLHIIIIIIIIWIRGCMAIAER